MEKEYTCVNEVFADDLLEEITDDLMTDDTVEVAMGVLDDRNLDDGDLIDIVLGD